MSYTRLFIFVEGPDDTRFFETILKPRLEKSYDWVEVRSYANWKTSKVNGFIRSITAMPAQYIFVSDRDNAPCITKKKASVRRKYRRLDEANVAVVVKEIEGWYLAGLAESLANRVKVRTPARTDELSKEQFIESMPRGFDSRIDWMAEILKSYSTKIASRRNRSFGYFLRHFMP